MAYYKIIHPATGKVVNLYSTSSTGAVANGTRLLLYTWENNNDQKWALDYVGDLALLRLARDTGKVMNRHSDNNNAIVWTYDGAEETKKDSLINTETENGNMRIKLVHRDLYLTKNLNDNYLCWAGKMASNRQYFKLEEVDGGSDSSNILSKDTAVPTATASSPYIITNIPDKQQTSGFDTNVEFHPGCGFANGTNFNSSTAGSLVKNALQKYVKKVFGSGVTLSDAQTCYYLYGERYANGSGQQFHPGVDINYKEGAPIYAVHGGSVVFAGGAYGTVSIKVSSMNNIVTNYIHMKNITVKAGDSVTAGTVIGYQSNVGTQSTHLHFEVRVPGASGPAGSTYSPANPMTTIKPYGYMTGE